MHPEAARQLADHALTFIAADEALAAALLDACGASPKVLREMAERPEFALFLLDFLLESDQRVLAFAEAEGVAPDRIMAARAALSGPGEDWP